jgi:hypothetical protein
VRRAQILVPICSTTVVLPTTSNARISIVQAILLLYSTRLQDGTAHEAPGTIVLKAQAILSPPDHLISY